MFIIPLHLGFEISFLSIPSLYCPVYCKQYLLISFCSFLVPPYQKAGTVRSQADVLSTRFPTVPAFPCSLCITAPVFPIRSCHTTALRFQRHCFELFAFHYTIFVSFVAFAMLSLDFCKPVLSLFWVPLLFWFSLLFWGSLFFCSSLFFGFSVLWGSLLFRLLFLSSRDAPGDVRTHPSDPCRDPSCKDGRLLS